MKQIVDEPAGYEELHRLPGRSLNVWAPDLAGLFSAAAQGMNAISGAELKAGPRISRTFEAKGPDAESLLVAFLSDLAFAARQQKLGFDAFVVILGDGRIKVAMTGAALRALPRPVRVVTFHNLAVIKTERGLEAEIAFEP